MSKICNRKLFWLKITTLLSLLLQLTIYNPSLNAKENSQTNLNANFDNKDQKSIKSLLIVNTTTQAYNFFKPWEKLSPKYDRGLGTLIGKNKLLVNAFLVQDATYIEVENPENNAKCAARISLVDYEFNLSVIELTGENKNEFLKDFEPIKIEPEVKLGDNLLTWQIDDNGDFLKTTINVNRFDVFPYSRLGPSLLYYEGKGSLFNSAINYPMPVVKNKKLAGLVYSYSSSNQTVYVLPGLMIQKFLKQFNTGKYKGLPQLGINYASTIDTQFKKYLKIDKLDNIGVYITKVFPDSSADIAGIKQGDIITKIGKYDITARGYYNDKKFGKILLNHLVSGKYNIGDAVEITLIRKGKGRTVTADLKRRAPEDYYVDHYMFDRGPKYYIIGGLVFQELTNNYLRGFGGKWQSKAPFNLVYRAKKQTSKQKNSGDKVVFLSSVIPNKAALGYYRLRHLIVTKINDTKINNILDLKRAFEYHKKKIHKIEFETNPKLIFLDSELAEESKTYLQKVYKIKKLERVD